MKNLRMSQLLFQYRFKAATTRIRVHQFQKILTDYKADGEPKLLFQYRFEAATSTPFWGVHQFQEILTDYKADEEPKNESVSVPMTGLKQQQQSAT